jgi:alkylation response protein AidB-like acyl-CoA dehydrogenase
MSSPPQHPSLHRLPLWVQEKLSPKAIDLLARVHTFVEEECIPAEGIYKSQIAQPGKKWQHPPIMLELRERAKKAGLFNLFLPKTFGELSPGLTNLEYACCADLMGRCYWAAQVSFNSSRLIVRLCPWVEVRIILTD